MLRVMVALAVVAATAWGAYWFVGAQALERTVGQTLADHPALTAESHRVRGFPNRFDLTLSDPRLETPGLTWQAPFLQVFALSYRPHHVIVVLPHDQRVQVAGQAASLQVEDARASLVMTPGLSLPLERMAMVVRTPRLQMDGASHRADTLRIASRATDPRRHEAVVEIETAFPDPGLLDRVDPDNRWPRRFDIIRVEGQVLFDRPLDRSALMGPLPRPVALQLTGARLAFDEIDLHATGEVEADEAGRLSGPLSVSVTNWPRLLQQLAEAGAIDDNQAGFLRPMLAGMADPATPERVELSLTLREGALSIGPVKLAHIPPLF